MPGTLEHSLLAPSVWSSAYFDGRWIPGERTISVLEPATSSPLGRVGEVSCDAVDTLVGRATAGQVAWFGLSPDERAATLRRAAAILADSRDELVEMLIRETGGWRGKALAEFQAAVDELNYAASIPLEPEGVLLPSSVRGRKSMGRKIPLGVVGVITPWNFPLVLALRSVAPALAAGNAVVLKPDPQTAISGGVAIARALELAGLPEGAFILINGGAAVGEALTRAAGIRMITFTGSTAVGRQVGRTAGELLKKVSLELGGKSPFIVLDDADLDAAASAGAWNSFLHQGQICMAAGRHIVQGKVADAYVTKLAKKAEALRVGDPWREEVELGPIINDSQCARIAGIVEQSVAQGAQLVAGGTRQGRFYRPTVLTNVTPGMPAYDLEIFGPVAVVVTVEDDDQAIHVANDTEYGLSGAVRTASLDRGIYVAERVRSGMFHINDQTINDQAGVPFGGTGASGNGSRFGHPINHDEFTEWRWLTLGSGQKSYPY